MKITAMLIMFLMSSFVSSATSPSAKLTYDQYQNMKLVFSDYENANGFENYQCVIVIDRAFALIKKANARRINKQKKFECIYQGELTTGVYYEVYFIFEDRPHDYKSNSPTFLLKAEKE